MSSKESVGKTFLVAGVLCIVCSVLVSVAAVGLKPIQQKNQELDKKKNILAAAGLLSEGGNVDAIFNEKIRVKAVNLASGEYDESIDLSTYDQRKAAKDPASSVAIPAGKDIAGIKRRALVVPVYEVMEGGVLTKVILPVHGKGLWSTLYGFLAIQADTKTVAGLGFYSHAETPGLGGEVDNPKWKATWKGKKLYNDDWKLVISVIKGVVDTSSPKGIHQVDGLSGATITTNGVDALIRYWVGPEGFEQYLVNIRKRGQGNG